MLTSRFLGSWCALLLSASAGVAQQALAPFDAATIVVGEEGPPIRRMADLDLDGDVDAFGWQVATMGEQFRFRVFLNDGQGDFSPLSSVTATDPSRELVLLGEIGFLDAGAIPDFCLIHGDQLHVRLGLGDGTFQVGAPIVLPAAAVALALADLDGDGRDDFVWADGLALHLETSLGFETSVPHALTGPETLRVLPADGPNQTDVLLLHASEELRLFTASPEAGIVPGPTFLHGLAGSMFDTGDVDGDGDVDGVVFGMGMPPALRVLRRQGVDAWELEPAVGGGPGEFLRDVDGDLDLDGVCCGGGQGVTYDPSNWPSPFVIALNDGSGVFAEGFEIPGIGSPQLAGVVDVDDDGDSDLVAGACVYYAHGPVRPPLSPPGSVVPPAADPREIADCDGDGDPDVGFALDSAFLNDGSGHFFPSTHGVRRSPNGARYTGPGYPGDFDGDGDLDLLAWIRFDLRGVTPSGSSRQRPLAGMTLLENDGEGALSYAGLASEVGVTFALDSLAASASLLADLEGDGDLDLITRALAPQSDQVLSRLWANDGTGFFEAAPSLPPGRRIELAIDLDLDGVIDPVAAEYPADAGGNRYLRVYRGVVSGAGQPPTFVQTSFNNFGRLMGNLSAGNLHSSALPDSGYPDLFFVGSFSGVQGVVSLNGFDPTVLSWGSATAGPWHVPASAHALVGDLNNDGLDDELLGAFGGPVPRSAVRLKFGASWPAFSTKLQILPTGWLVDVDMDGDLDLLGDDIVLNRVVP